MRGVHLSRIGAIPIVGVALIAVAVATSAVAQTEPPGPVAADRVTLQFESGNFELVSINPFSTVLAPADDLPREVGQVSGFWYELRDANGELRYRRVIGDPVRLFFEGPDPDASPMMAPLDSGVNKSQRRAVRDRTAAASAAPDAAESPRRTEALGRPRANVAMTGRLKDGVQIMTADRVEAIPARRAFAVVIPRAQDGDVLVLFGAPVEPGTQADAADELARFVLLAPPA